ncbi:pyrrolidone-carboxylate peptidase-like isoform X1 [Eucalyptus grandis]|uniref:pyrrolidone-carboxylate peptidase-like isoform X1 n=1 Tax=Eucalyptus grandis TaxID=71139 RepID=UPI00192F0CA2|nr:pyrrolidone-carboxylate peptidase-like isoform X1 [Eucalyptus grandis]
MGSEGPKPVTINVTGFKKFQGVPENPTETIVNNLKSFVEKKGLPPGVTFGTCTVLEAAGDGALPMLFKVMESGISSDGSTCDAQVVWLHLGVNSGAHKFAIERQAVNEATFRCPDELGWRPQQLPIVPEDGKISRTRQIYTRRNVVSCLRPLNPVFDILVMPFLKTSFSTKAILEFLKKKGYDVTLSDDAGRFVCNYVYYHSLRLAEQRGSRSLFVHVPPFSRIDEETQMNFVASLLEAIASSC